MGFVPDIKPPVQTKKNPGLGLNLQNLGNQQDYNDEFLDHINEFSESWRL